MEHNVFRSRVRRRTGWVAETVKIYVVCNASGGVKEGVHEILKRAPLRVSNLELRQLVFFDILAVHSDQRQDDFFHSCTRSGIWSVEPLETRGLEIVPPKARVQHQPESSPPSVGQDKQQG